MNDVKALLFDVQGTAVDFYRPLLAAGARQNAAKGLSIDWGALSVRWRVLYRATGEHPHLSLAQALAAEVQAQRPDELVMVAAGEWRLMQSLDAAAAQCGVPLRKVPDRHFLIDEAQFAQWMGARKQPRLEHFYRWMRRRTGLLMAGEEPVGG